MLTLIEKIIFIIAVLLTIYAAWMVVKRLIKIIGRGQGRPDLKTAKERLFSAIFKTITLSPTFRFRIGPSLFHAMIAWGFMFYIFVNLGDVYEAFFANAQFLGTGLVGDIYRLVADILSIGAFLGMAVLMVRRLVIKPDNLRARETILLNRKARSGITRDSIIVGVFILLHVGFRFLGASFKIGLEGKDSWQPFASAFAGLWQNWTPLVKEIGVHVSFWIAIGLIMLFIPYLPYTKHIHLIFAPINFLLTPKRRSIGELSSLNFEDESVEEFGVLRLEDLGYEQILDAYACIMCFRCQEVCPAYNTGKVLSPAALEINKRYFLNLEGNRLAKGDESEQTLLEFAISPEAIWACTACGACIDICPVGNEPMRDILDIRRELVLMENNFPSQFQNAFRGMERNMNPWNISPAERMKWAEGLPIQTIEENSSPDILWWVGCAPATDVRAQKTAQAFAKILNKAGVNFAVLGTQEQCTGDAARRAGNEYLFYELASANVEMLNEVSPKRIVTTCPHCLHTLLNEYPQFGGNYKVIHHTELINELVGSGKLKLKANSYLKKVTFHDPCYLGRHNGLVNEPRVTLDQVVASRVEMPQNGAKSFCCGAGGAQFWKEEEHGDKGVNVMRFQEASTTGAETLAVGCPFCNVMLTDASKDAGSGIEIQDIAEIILETLE